MTSGISSMPKDTSLHGRQDAITVTDLRDFERDATPNIPTPLPKLQLSVILYLHLAEPLTGHVMLPFIVQLIEETGITGGDITKVGYYAGLVESLFFITEALMILQWGRLSDRVGRRPILLVGSLGLSLSMIFFGLSHTFWAVVASRALAGALNGNSGVIKCMISEVTDETNIAQAFAFMPSAWALGNTIAPLIGGGLQHPYERFGGLFRNSEFWKEYPYFLPCLVAAVYSVSAYVLVFFFLKETAPAVVKRRAQGTGNKFSLKRDNTDSYAQSSSSTERSPLIPSANPPSSSLRRLLTPRVLLIILAYSTFAMTEISFVVLQPLFLSTPISHGGLGMTPSFIGMCLAAFGVASGAASALLFARLHRRFGPKVLLMASTMSFLIVFPLFPIMNALARAHGGLNAGVWVVFIIQLSLMALPPMGYSCIFIFLTSAPPSRGELGATSGLAQTTTSIMRAIGPAGATSLFAFSIERNVLGGSLVYVILCIVAACTVAVVTLLPTKPWPRAED